MNTAGPRTHPCLTPLYTLKTSCVPQSFPLGSVWMAVITAKRSGGQPAQSKHTWLVETVWGRIQVRIRKFYERLAMLDWARSVQGLETETARCTSCWSGGRCSAAHRMCSASRPLSPTSTERSGGAWGICVLCRSWSRLLADPVWYLLDLDRPGPGKKRTDWNHIWMSKDNPRPKF